VALRHRFGAAFDQLSGDEVQAVVTAQMEGVVTNQRLQGMLTMHRVDITQMLGALVQRRFLTSDGVGRGTRYFVAGELTPPVMQGSPPVSGGAYPANGGAYPAVLEAREIVNLVRATQRAKPEQMRQAIHAVCAGEFLTAQQIAKILGRSKKRLQDQFLGPCVPKANWNCVIQKPPITDSRLIEPP
jgi:ATP-dependent DNA helicase RecG